MKHFHFLFLFKFRIFFTISNKNWNWFCKINIKQLKFLINTFYNVHENLNWYNTYLYILIWMNKFKWHLCMKSRKCEPEKWTGNHFVMSLVFSFKICISSLFICLQFVITLASCLSCSETHTLASCLSCSETHTLASCLSCSETHTLASCLSCSETHTLASCLSCSETHTLAWLPLQSSLRHIGPGVYEL